MRRGPPFSYQRRRNYDVVPFRTYTMSTSHRNPKLLEFPYIASKNVLIMPRKVIFSDLKISPIYLLLYWTNIKICIVLLKIILIYHLKFLWLYLNNFHTNNKSYLKSIIFNIAPLDCKDRCFKNIFKMNYVNMKLDFPSLMIYDNCNI